MQEHADRKAWMSTLAKADPALLGALWDDAGFAPDYAWLRPPEIAAVMVQGRAGATGAPFCLGEMTVTRCALRLDSGEVGHAVVQGRDKQKATQAALVDALMQSQKAQTVEGAVITPLRHAKAQAEAARAGKAAATKVDFFTMVRGED